MFITGNTGWPKGSSQLKPAAETWWLSRTGRSTALNIEGCRVGTQSTHRENRAPMGYMGNAPAAEGYATGSDSGRYPPNAVFSHAPGCRCVGERRVLPNGQRRFRTEFGHSAEAQGYGGAVADFTTSTNPGIDPDGTETVEAWECVEGCPVRELDAQSGESTSAGGQTNARSGWRGAEGCTRTVVTKEDPGFGDTGTAARFFPQFPADEAALFGYHAKPSRAERDAGVEGDGNIHSTVKSIALMRWLVRLVTRPGDVVLDPFGGSGTTGVAALCEGRRVILVEREPRFAEIARQRCEHATPDLGVPVRVAAKPAPAADPRQRSLLDLLGSTP